MNSISVVSEITAQDLAEYIRIDEVTVDDINLLNNLLNVAEAYIKNYTGQTDLDSSYDFVIVVFVLVQDMYDNRTMYVDSTNLNQTVESILAMHSVNLLPTVDTT